MNCEACGHENLEGAHFCAQCGVQMLHDSADQESWIGRLVGGRFRVKRVLGEGGMGIVYEGEQQMGSTTRRVAIKTLHSHLSGDPSVLARFHRECGTVSELEHPNTIKFYDFGKEEDGTLYIAMEFLDGLSLDKVIEQEGALPPSRTVKILKQICGALEEAHEKGVIHRDLKPENIVLTERLGEKDFVKVLDFGIASRSESADREKEAKLTQQGMVLGTPPYMSPEQFTGEELDRRSDVYSLGVMAYEMLTAQLPFQANTPWQWATEHMTAQPFPIDQVPTGGAVPRPMREAVMRALAKIPDQRPSTANELLTELESGLAGAVSGLAMATEEMQAVPTFAAGSQAAPIPEPVSTTTESALSSTQGFTIPQKKSNGGLIAGVLAVLVALGAGAFLLRGKEKPQETPEESPPAATTPEVEDAPEPPEKTDPDPNHEKKGDEDAAEESTDGGDGATPAPSPAPSPKPAPTPAPPPKPQPGDFCTDCIASVRGGNWSAAVSQFSSCTSTGKPKCTAEAKKQAPSQVARAVKKGRCGQASTIVKQASALNAASSLLRVAASKCKTKKK